jgi:hypothetical protein
MSVKKSAVICVTHPSKSCKASKKKKGRTTPMTIKYLGIELGQVRNTLNKIDLKARKQIIMARTSPTDILQGATLINRALSSIYCTPTSS